MTGRLLVVAPHGTRTGSTQVLIGLLARLAPGLDVDLAVEVRSDGPRRRELQAFGPPLTPGERPAAVFVNSALAAEAILEHPPGVPAAVYVHEAPVVVASLAEVALRGLRRADRVLCVSESAADGLAELGIGRSRLAVVPPLVVPADRVPAADATALRRSLGIGRDDRLVVGCGEASERKGTDLFVELASRLASDPTVHFVWVGRRLRAAARVLDVDVEACGLTGRLRWMDEVADPAVVLAAADALAMPSREDPQPLVPFEAAFQGTPTVAFEVGGLDELARRGVVAGVPFPDTTALARRLLEVMDDPAIASSLVQEATSWALERQGPAAVVPVVRSLLQALLARPLRP